jgi:hypothetical protein
MIGGPLLARTALRRLTRRPPCLVGWSHFGLKEC